MTGQVSIDIVIVEGSCGVIITPLVELEIDIIDYFCLNLHLKHPVIYNFHEEQHHGPQPDPQEVWGFGSEPL